MQYGIGIVGTGMIARHHARTLAEEPGARVAAVFSRDASRGAADPNTIGTEGHRWPRHDPGLTS